MDNYYCNLCNTQIINQDYRVTSSKNNAIISVCRKCGLVQTIFDTNKLDKSWKLSFSSGADWGNIRHGKGLRFSYAQRILDKYLDWKTINTVLDIGSNRGSFIGYCKSMKIPDIVAIEPDKDLKNNYSNIADIIFYSDRYENIILDSAKFDLIYCSHTLEHTSSPLSVLNKINKELKADGLCFLEVPNFDYITDDKIVEEFFIDKHPFHFDRKSIYNFIELSNFEIIYENSSDDIYNITLLIKKKHNIDREIIFNEKVAIDNIKKIENYRKNLQKNISTLKNVVNNKLEPFLKRQKVAFWGAGRIFDALVKYGNLNSKLIFCLIDEYLSKYLDCAHGVEIRKPEFLKISSPDVLIILAKSSSKAIESKARKMGVKNIIKFDDIL